MIVDLTVSISFNCSIRAFRVNSTPSSSATSGFLSAMPDITVQWAYHLMLCKVGNNARQGNVAKSIEKVLSEL